MLATHVETDERVDRFIKANFANEGVQVKSHPAVPSGRVLTDKNDDQMFVFFDAAEDRVSYLFL